MLAVSVLISSDAALSSRYGSAAAVRASQETNRPKEKCLLEGDDHGPGVGD